MGIVKKDVLLSAGPLQLCAGTPSGCEAAMHTMIELFDEPDIPGVLLVDATNVSNSLNRKGALHNVDVGGSQEFGGFVKNRLFGSKNLISLLDSALDQALPVASVHMGNLTLCNWASFFFFPAKNVGIVTLTSLVVAAFPLEMAIFAGFFLANSTRKGGITEFQVAAIASHFRDQGSLTVGCLHFPFPCLLTRSRGG